MDLAAGQCLCNTDCIIFDMWVYNVYFAELEACIKKNFPGAALFKRIFLSNK